MPTASRSFATAASSPPGRRPSSWPASPAVEISYRLNGEEVVLRTPEPTRVLHELTAKALSEGRELERLQVRPRTLEDVYLEVTEDEA